jgi:transglutaminase-like putative cysteine protease
MKNLTFILLCFFISATAIAQDFAHGVSRPDLEMKQYNKDTSAHALVITEFGKSSLVVPTADEVRLQSSNLNTTTDDEYRLIFEYHVKIKIFDSKGFKVGNVVINARDRGNMGEIIDEITGTTTYIDDNGAIKTVNLNTKSIVRQKENSNLTTVKFTMPELRNGCVIEYTYRSISPFWEGFRPWYFQGDLPKLYSEYDAHIPAFWNYKALMRGGLSLTKRSAVVELGCFSSHGAASDCSHLNFIMTDIPAFIDGNYMTSPKNYKSAIYFTLTDFTNPATMIKKQYAKEWADIDQDIKRDDLFGGQLKNTNKLKSYISPVIADKTTELDKAKAIYAYIQKNIKLDNPDLREGSVGIIKALNNHSGSAGDINLALVTALNAAGINADAVLLSTRENGLINKAYATVNDFNYVIAKVDIGDKSYFLDATDPLLSFGLLPLKCLNGEGRAINMNKASYWVDIKTPQIQKSTTSLDLTLQNDGRIKGTYVRSSTGYVAYERRKAIKNAASTDEYISSSINHADKIKILKANITNIDSVDRPVIETYEVELNNQLAFNPFIINQMVNNPFIPAERNYPVDMGMPTDARFVLTMHLPAQYTLTSAPQKITVPMPNKGGQFETDFQPGDNSFTYSAVMQLNRPIYDANEYPYLRELFDKVVETEKTQLVFKKKI